MNGSPAGALERIDWSHPAFVPWAAHGIEVSGRIDAGLGVAAALNLSHPPRRFVDHAARPAGSAYEAFIADSATVPTRENLHDLFNGLAWLRHPALKARMNRWQAEAIARDGVGGRRGALRDALTLFDEFGALLDGSAELAAALRQRNWQRLFVDLREHWATARFELIGHALLEQLVLAPRKALTAFVWIGDPLAAADPLLWQTKPFCPLPVAGIPGWWPHQDAAFYADAAVFRRTKPLAVEGPA